MNAISPDQKIRQMEALVKQISSKVARQESAIVESHAQLQAARDLLAEAMKTQQLSLKAK